MEWRTGEPEESGEYVVLYKSGTISNIPFSKVHRLFNFRDSYSEECREEFGVPISRIAAWVPYEEFIEGQWLKNVCRNFKGSWEERSRRRGV